jgi:hypothetical protein
MGILYQKIKSLQVKIGECQHERHARYLFWTEILESRDHFLFIFISRGWSSAEIGPGQKCTQCIYDTQANRWMTCTGQCDY